ncbi:MAG: DNA repair exonuclease, partial [Actinobacteria bacterium]|nr:DNA repair exonuclease [Actinomycetota bacterium]
DEDARLLVIAGDLYDGDWNDYATGAFFVRQMDELNDLGIPVVIASGNHDAESQITRALRLPPNVTMLPVDRPGSKVLEDLGIVVHGQGYPTRDLTENLVAAYPGRIPSLVNVGVLHTAVTGAEGHALYAPCSPQDLQMLKYDYFALGHVHQRGAVAEGEHPAWFSGNLQGRHARETGPKGALVVDFEPGRPAQVDFRALDVARWEQVMVDVTDLSDTDAILDAIEASLCATVGAAEGRRTVARIRMVGTSRLAARLQDTEWLDAEVDRIQDRVGAVVETVKVDVVAPKAPDPEAALLRAAMANTADRLRETPVELTELLKTLDREIRDIAKGASTSSADSLDLTDEGVALRLLENAQSALDARLAGLEH